MNAVANNLMNEMARDTAKNVKASTSQFIAGSNENRRPAGHESTPSREISMGELTLIGLEKVKEGMQRSRESDLASENCRLAAGMSREEKRVPTEKETARRRLIDQMLKDGDPDRLYMQLCAGVGTRNPATGLPYLKASTARWLAQGIANEICRLAGNAIIERKRESGIIAGIDYQIDDAGMFVGTESTNTDDLNIARGGQQTTENVFLQHCDDVDTIEGTYQEWYSSIEKQLSALAGAAMTGNGSIMGYSQYVRWEDKGDGSVEQKLDTLEDYIERELTRRNDGPQRTSQPAANDNLAKLFG